MLKIQLFLVLSKSGGDGVLIICFYFQQRITGITCELHVAAHSIFVAA